MLDRYNLNRKVSKKLKKSIPRKMEQRLIISGRFVTEPDDQKQIYTFWASEYLVQQDPRKGDLVVVSMEFFSEVKNRTAIRKGVIYITDIEPWSDGKEEPDGIAAALYGGKNYEEYIRNMEG